METKEFIEKFAEQLETELSNCELTTNFRDLEEWSSLAALNVLMMIDEEYGVALPADEMRKVNTIQELFDLVQSKL